MTIRQAIAHHAPGNVAPMFKLTAVNAKLHPNRQRGERLTVNGLDPFYCANLGFVLPDTRHAGVETEPCSPGGVEKPRNNPSMLPLQWISSHGHSNDMSCRQASEALLYFTSKWYQTFHSLSPIPPSLNASPYLQMTLVNLTSTGKPVTVYMNEECCEQNHEEILLLPLNKAKTQYITVRRSDLKSIQESVCDDHIGIDHVYHLNDSAFKSMVTSIQPTVIQHNFQCQPIPNDQRKLVPQQHGQGTSKIKKLLALNKRSHLKVRPLPSRESMPFEYSSTFDLSTTSSLLEDEKYESKDIQSCSTKPNGDAHNVSECQSIPTKMSKPSKNDKIFYLHKVAPDRPLRKLGEAKLKGGAVPCQETGSSSSSLKFSKDLSILNVLRRHAYQNALEVILPTRNISSETLRSSVERVLRERAASQSRTTSNQQATSVRHRVRQRYAEAHQSRTESLTRDVDRDCATVRLTRLPFDSKEVTQLLHASDYSKIVQQVGNPSTALKPDSYIPSHFIVGVAYFKMTRYSEAREHFKKCESVAKEAGRDGDIMVCNAYLGDIEYTSQNYTKAAQFYKTAIEHYAPGNVAPMFKLTAPSLSAVNAKLASSYRNASMMIPAIQHYKSAIGEARTDRDRLSAHTSLGNLYQSMGDNGNALEQYKESIQLAEKLSDYISLGWAHGNIGNAYLGLNRKDEALYHLQKSLDLAVEYEQTYQAIGRAYNNLGTAYQSMSDLDKAEEFYDLALSHALYGNDIPGQARVYGNIGNVYMLRKNYDRAVPHYSEVLTLSNDPSTINTARHNRGCAYYDWATSLYRKNALVNSAGPNYECTIHHAKCDKDECLRDLPHKAKELYREGSKDLQEVVKFHEERLEHIKGSAKGLTLSVSLFELNSRTFHRLQDCLVSLHQYEEALVVAEQSRARTLGELLLKRKGEEAAFSSPLSYGEIEFILKSHECPLLYFSYTGARLICWLFLPHIGGVDMKSFEIPLAEDQFNGKSFNHFLRYSLTENLVERSFEMYQAIRYSDEGPDSEVQALYRLVGKPTLKILRENGHSSDSQKVTTISDSYTSLLPLTCLFDGDSKSFLGDSFFFNKIPSLMTMGVINKSPDIKVDLGGDSRDFCIVGDPNIPPFYHKGELWSLGRLPHARKEAEWVAHALNTTPVLGDQATKSSLLIRLMNAKVVHIATHGSASTGFLAFSSYFVHANERLAGRNQVHGTNVLLYPEDIEKLTFSPQHPALVVLSSCNSGRGVLKADGIQGMARAFILAGAQSVLTTLWKVPDESASVFMQFFYQYLLDEMKSSLALQKAILSIRCFAKYSQYIHWSGYQLTGRDIQFLSKPSQSSIALKKRLGEPSVFPRLASVKKLENALVNSPCLPTDVQVHTCIIY